MKKFSIIIVSILITCCLILLINSNYYEGKIITDSKTQNILNTNSLTMMYETDYQSGEYQVSSDTTWPQDGYIFNERLSKCENGGVLSWDDENKKVLLQTNTSDKCFVYFDKAPNTLASYIINNVYTGVDGDNGLYYHDGIGSYTNADQEAGDYSYRYAGANPNNYVCFGSDEELCPEDNLYRIIGVFNNQVKLIKNSSIGSTCWDGSDCEEYFNSNEVIATLMSYNVEFLAVPDPSSGFNDWNISVINKLLNSTGFFDKFDYSWQEKIVTSLWYIGGTENGDTIVKEFFSAERNEDTYNGKIGLIYVSDYGYAASPDYWTTQMKSFNTAINNNWMYAGGEWTITKSTLWRSQVFWITSSGELECDRNVDSIYTEIRPVFYLNSDVAYISGSGTQTDPYRIN